MQSLIAESVERRFAVPSRLAMKLVRTGRRISGLADRIAQARKPPFAALATAVLGATLVYGVSVGGHTVAVVDGVAQPLGFGIDKVEVEGNAETSEIDALQALWQTGSQSLFSLDPSAARQTLEAMPWVDRASVAKIFPDQIKITLSEHKPYAVWQKDDGFVVVDREGREIVPFTPGRFGSLPVVVGPGAAVHAAALIDEMEALPDLRARIKAYVRVGDRRWNLRLDNGVAIELPEDDPIAALADVDRLDRAQGLLSRDIASVDMRLDDRVVVKLTPDAMERRDAALKERAKLVKQQSRKDKPV